MADWGWLTGDVAVDSTEARPRAHICVTVIDAHYSIPVDSILFPPFEDEFRLALGMHADTGMQLGVVSWRS